MIIFDLKCNSHNVLVSIDGDYYQDNDEQKVKPNCSTKAFLYFEQKSVATNCISNVSTLNYIQTIPPINVINIILCIYIDNLFLPVN